MSLSEIRAMGREELNINLSFYRRYNPELGAIFQNELNERFKPEEIAEMTEHENGDAPPALAKCQVCAQKIPVRRDGTLVPHKWPKKLIACNGSDKKWRGI